MGTRSNLGLSVGLALFLLSASGGAANAGVIDFYSMIPERETSTLEPGRHFTFEMQNEDLEGTLWANQLENDRGEAVDVSPLLFDVTSRRPSNLDPQPPDHLLLAAGGTLMIRTGCFASGRRCGAPLHLDGPRRRAIARSVLWQYLGETPVAWRGNLSGMDPYGESEEDQQSIVLTSLDADDRQAAGYAARLIFQ